MINNKNSKHCIFLYILLLYIILFVYTTDYFAISKVGKDQYLKNIVIMGVLS